MCELLLSVKEEKVIELTAEQFSVSLSRISNHTQFIDLEG